MKTNFKQPGSAVSISLLLASVLVASSMGFGADDDTTNYFRDHESRGHNSNSNGNNKHLPAILMHKQALQQDGGFQYAFASDNGHRQGESIRPDGSRTGAYSYTDPNGKEISVKYSAGKDGFRILQGDHIPKAPLSVAPSQPQQSLGYAPPPSSGRSNAPGKNRLFGAPGGPGSQFSRGDLSGAAKYFQNSAESPSPSPYKSKLSKPQHYRVREDNSAEFPGKFDDDGSSAFDGAGDYSSHSPFRAPATPAHFAYNGAASDSNSQKDGGSSASNEPHSFGNGYAFEFGGNNNNNNNGGESAEF